MPTPQNTLADAVLASVPLLERFLKGFDDSNHTRQAPGLPNHAAWCLCHLALTMHRAAEKIDGRDLTGDDFAPGHPPGGSPPRKCYAESVAFGSVPVDDVSKYPPLARCVEIFRAAADRVADAARRASDADLSREMPWGASSTTAGALVGRMVFHNGMHAGQIADLRRALGMGSILG